MKTIKKVLALAASLFMAAGLSYAGPVRGGGGSVNVGAGGTVRGTSPVQPGASQSVSGQNQTTVNTAPGTNPGQNFETNNRFIASSNTIAKPSTNNSAPSTNDGLFPTNGSRVLPGVPVTPIEKPGSGAGNINVNGGNTNETRQPLNR